MNNNCIDHVTGERYISFLEKEGLSIFNPAFIDTSYKWESLSTRQRGKLILEIKTNIIHSFLFDYKHPFFYLLNLIVSKESDKHATCLTIEYNRERNIILLDFFDSNGELEKRENTYGNFIWKLLSGVKIQLEEMFYTVELSEARKNKPNINIYGDGHCNALMFYYMTFRHKKNTDQTNTILDGSEGMTKKRIDNINQTIKKREKLNEKYNPKKRVFDNII